MNRYMSKKMGQTMEAECYYHGYSDDDFKRLGFPKGKPVKSTDFYHEIVVKELKAQSRGTKVTDIRYHGCRNGAQVFSGSCMVTAKGRPTLRLGRFVVEL